MMGTCAGLCNKSQHSVRCPAVGSIRHVMVFVWGGVTTYGGRESVEIVNVQQIRTVEVGYRTNTRSNQFATVPQEALMLTKDENIIDIQFTQNPISIIDQHGINDTANTYLYFSTVADRYWNESTISNTVFSTSSPMPNSYTLNQNYPNPFNSETDIVFSIPKLKNIKIDIWSLDGRLIKTLLDSRLIPGQYGIKWFGKNNSGKIQSTGIYFSTLSVDQKIIKTRKLIYVK